MTFMPGTPARAAEVNGNFAAVKAAVDDNHARIGTLQSGVSGLDGRVTALESADAALGRWMYGDGSAGDLVVAGSTQWLGSQEPANLNFNNCTIPSGTTLVVRAGTTVRCAGTFTNDGTITVLLGAQGGYINFPRATVVGTGITPPHPGDMNEAAGMPSFDTDGVYTSTMVGGRGSAALSKTYVLSNLARLHMGGGAGSGAAGSAGGIGGGLIRVLAKGALVNNGRIDANGATGAGGGGGGIVILASRASIRNAGTITVQGGQGSSTDLVNASSGGGGGGIVVLAAPSIENTGTTDVAPGASGSVTRAIINPDVRGGGGGGGGSGGAGGLGGSLSGETSTTGLPGQAGFVLTLQQDPLFVVN
ncbi:hypothetical protein GCM10011487_25420 [Steroidobacter agaridevorans]|uniref:Uncharacterized protein n=1 Tax=Steroidobacter agaridevorans TaxID=2695856 RepID=A0A829YD29_9GAMM|nr:hypothetical protein GCM10011487_25420 [Steroidobacter agaridevorans]